MAFMDSGVMVSSDDFFKVSSCIDSVITGGGSAREWIVSDWKLVSSDLCFAQIKKCAVHGLKFCRVSQKSHYDALRIFRNASERFAYGVGAMPANVSCCIALKNDGGYGVFAGLGLLFEGFRHVTNFSYRVVAPLLCAGRGAVWTCL